MQGKSSSSNRLIKEKSPYLLQHAHNPVDWYPWGEEAFAKAVEKITGLPGTEYQKMLEEMVAGAASDGAGEILLSERDRKRIDRNFTDNIYRRLKTFGRNGTVALSDETVQTAGGFVLRYGDMEINGTFEIVFDMLRPQIENDVVNILFS